MKLANAGLAIAAGVLFLWVVTSGRTKNLAAAWQALVGSVTGSSGTTGAAMSSAAGGSYASLPSLPSLGSSSGAVSTGLEPSGASIDYGLPSLAGLNLGTLA